MSLPWAVCVAVESLWTRSEADHQSPPEKQELVHETVRILTVAEEADCRTYNASDKVEVLRHHVVEVICDEDSSHEELRERRKIWVMNQSRIKLLSPPKSQNSPWWSRSSWYRIRRKALCLKPMNTHTIAFKATVISINTWSNFSSEKHKMLT